ncbi:MAG TPA: P-loop NTPase [Treponema sp.]|nr:P-loop NTPase [Treponema sp.]
MKEIVIISGKGGTGKTSITAALAAIASRKHRMVFADCDVDASDLHLVFNPEVLETKDFYSGHVARIDPQKCISYGECTVCKDLCRFDSIRYSHTTGMVIDETACEGCGVCVRFCPARAIEFPDRYCGESFVSNTRFGPLVHAALDIGAENSGKLVTLVRTAAKKIAEKGISGTGENPPAEYLIVDGSPGTGCPVIASITGCDAVVIVTEPTLSGLHDLERVVALAKHFSIPAYVCVNKYDINEAQSNEIIAWCEAHGVPVLGTVPWHRSITSAQIEGLSVVEYAEKHGETTVPDAMRTIWENLWELTQ